MAAGILFPVSDDCAPRPLAGLTVLVVEDSRFAAQALRLLCLRSGARIRHADSLQAARRHLATFRPAAVIVDLGLPDGSGLQLIEELAAARPRIDVLLGISAGPEGRAAVLAAGADGFVEKPILSLARFQQALLAHLPAEGAGPRAISGQQIRPDADALAQDLGFVRAQLGSGAVPGRLDYLSSFVAGVAVQAGDEALASAARGLDRASRRGQPLQPGLRQLGSLIEERLDRCLAG